MKLVNRGFLSVSPTNEFLAWANQFSNGIEFTPDDKPEPTIYLIDEDFFEIEPVVERHFKSIFEQELELVNEDESTWPQQRTMELFLAWFQLEAGTTVFDLEKSDLRADV